MYLVWLVRQVGCKLDEGSFAEYIKAVRLPIPPSVGLSLIIDRGGDPSELDEVYINNCGAVICFCPNVVVDCAISEWKKERKWAIAGWKKMPLGGCTHDLPIPVAGTRGSGRVAE